MDFADSISVMLSKQISMKLQCESKKNPPPRGCLDFFHFFTNGSEFLIDFLHTYYRFLSSPDYKFLFNYLQLWWNYAIL